MRRLRWHWRLWRARHWAWVALMDWMHSERDLDYQRWERASHHVEEILLAGPNS